MIDILTTDIWVEITVTQLPTWDDLTIVATGAYKIYLCSSDFEEIISDPIIKISLPAVSSSAAKPTTEVIKLNRLIHTATVKGELRFQTPIIAGVDYNVQILGGSTLVVGYTYYSDNVGMGSGSSYRKPGTVFVATSTDVTNFQGYPNTGIVYRVIDSKTAKNILIDLFRMYQQSKLHWDGFKNDEANIVVERMTFAKSATNKDGALRDVKYNLNALFVLGDKKNIN